MSAAFHITFLGTQPTLTQVPPSRPDSTMATLAPYSAARCAAARPPLPAPMTTRSNASPIAPPESAVSDPSMLHGDGLKARLSPVRTARRPPLSPEPPTELDGGAQP